MEGFKDEDPENGYNYSELENENVSPILKSCISSLYKIIQHIDSSALPDTSKIQITHAMGAMLLAPLIMQDQELASAIIGGFVYLRTAINKIINGEEEEDEDLN